MKEYKPPLTPEQRKELIEKINMRLNKDPKYIAHIDYISKIGNIKY